MKLKITMAALVGAALLLSAPALGDRGTKIIKVRPDGVTVRHCAQPIYDAAGVPLITIRAHRHREMLSLGNIRHPGGYGTIGTYLRQGGGGMLVRLISSPDGRHMTIVNVDRGRGKTIRFHDQCRQPYRG